MSANNCNDSGFTNNGSVNVVSAARKDGFISVPLRREAGAIIKLLSYYYIQAERKSRVL